MTKNRPKADPSLFSQLLFSQRLKQIAELRHLFAEDIQPTLRMPDFHAHSGTYDHNRFVGIDSQKRPEALWYQQP